MRCYDGCPDDQLQALLDSQVAARKRLAKELPGATCTYFPAEGKYQCFTKDFRQVGDFSSNLFIAIETAIQRGTKYEVD